MSGDGSAPRATIGGKIRLIIACVCAGLSVVVGVSGTSFSAFVDDKSDRDGAVNAVRDAVGRIRSEIIQAQRSLEGMAAAFAILDAAPGMGSDRQSAIREELAQNTDAAYAAFPKISEAVANAFDALAPLIPNERQADLEGRGAQFEAQIAQIRTTADELIQLAGFFGGAELDEKIAQIRTGAAVLDQSLADLTLLSDVAAERARETTQTAVKAFYVKMLIFSAIALAAAAALALIIGRHLAQNIASVIAALERLAKGDLDARLESEPSTQDAARLSDAFETLHGAMRSAAAVRDEEQARAASDREKTVKIGHTSHDFDQRVQAVSTALNNMTDDLEAAAGDVVDGAGALRCLVPRFDGLDFG